MDLVVSAAVSLAETVSVSISILIGTGVFFFSPDSSPRTTRVGRVSGR